MTIQPTTRTKEQGLLNPPIKTTSLANMWTNKNKGL